MESPPLARYIPQKSKKRVFPGSSSSYMDPEVVEISPPISWSSKTKSLKQEEVMHHEIINVDMDEDSTDVMLIDEKVDTKNKGKEALANFSNGHSSAAKPGSVDGVQSSKRSCASGPHNSINLDGFSSDLSCGDDEYTDMYYDDLMYDDEYAILQAHFDNIDIPPGVEAPIPWLADPAQNNKKAATASSSTHSSLRIQSNPVGFPPGTDSSSSWCLPESAQIRKKSSSTSSSSLQTEIWSFPEPLQSKKLVNLTGSTYSSMQTQKSAVNLLPGVESLKPWRLLESSHSKKKPGVSVSTARYSSHDQLGGMKFSTGIEPSSGWSYFPNSSTKQVGNDYSGFFPLSDAAYIFPEEESYIPWVQDLAKSQTNPTAEGSSTIPFEAVSIGEKYGNENDILKKFQLFKQFDTVQDHSDHQYSRNGSSMKQPSKNWAKKIQEEWRILEKDLPGAEGTPYHDGLFFFDVFFPCNYPNVPPHVYYHSGGLRINPNLYNCGKVCLEPSQHLEW
ncbi:hypothetical protein F0562_010324 [Nyssa sinensis]|uniref:UBC core domain-containing protein n=1 Tax=Nyssa sinensis TaxID=561372 RepID=A0A5J5A3B4_9ASTE|nr:hypothetical protein F0562_010324 [Nyssa sinensis]